MSVNEKLDRALSDFRAGVAAGTGEENARWLEFLKKERAEAGDALAEADPLSDEVTQTPVYLSGWYDALDYLIHREGSYVGKD